MGAGGQEPGTVALHCHPGRSFFYPPGALAAQSKAELQAREGAQLGSGWKVKGHGDPVFPLDWLALEDGELQGGRGGGESLQDDTLHEEGGVE